VATELFKSYQSYFILRKKDKTAKAPSKISNTNFHTLVYNQSGWIFKKEIIVINKLPFKYKTNIIDIEKKNIKEIRIKFKNNKWLVDIVVEELQSFKSSITIQNKVLALDLGLKYLATGVDTNGKVITIPNKAKKIGRYFSNKIKSLQSKQSKCVKYSKRYTILNKVKSKLYLKKNAQIKQTLHIQSKKLVNMNYKTIVVGDLQIKNLMQLEKNKISKVSRSFGLSNIAMFVNMLTYKSVVLNQSVEKIDESNTTQLNCLTGKLFDSLNFFLFIFNLFY
jgi:transposase